MKRLYIGTSGWVYKGWAGAFYPPGVKGSEQLDFYVTQFPTVEINATFYRLPKSGMVKGWYRRAPKGFLFAIKGSRYITHVKRLNMKRGSISKIFRRIAPLKERYGALPLAAASQFQKKPSEARGLPR